MPHRSITLDPDQFNALYQVTHQISEFPASRLLETGCTADDLRSLITLLRDVKDRLEGVSRIRLLLIPGEVGDVGRPASAEESGADGESVREVRAAVPLRLAERWHDLARIAVDGLGPREVFLRTGYRPEEVDSMMTVLESASPR
ncbi:hypothetical protein GCM10010420_44750 [Streptomyces glaucosporus]|uniref:MarR family transcriptional regulator n=1 Tax=Streptomyces glaucosporus TaxID=284044 RepID=A0ABP5VSS6_9ACTN